MGGSPVCFIVLILWCEATASPKTGKVKKKRMKSKKALCFVDLSFRLCKIKQIPFEFMTQKAAQFFALVFALSGAAHAAVVATIPVQTGNDSDPNRTFNILMGSPGNFAVAAGNTGLQITDTTNPYTPAGTTRTSIWTVSAGTLIVTYHLQNDSTAIATQGLYEAPDGNIVTSGQGAQGRMINALTEFNDLVGGANISTTVDAEDPTLFITTYTFSEDSDAINKEVAFGFHRANGAGHYLFGKDGEENFVVLDFVPVPEPSTAILSALGLLALSRRRR